MLAAAAGILSVPLYLQRPTAYIVYACGLVVSMYLLTQQVGLERFLPQFYLKPFVSHLTREEPYQPDATA